ncbi:MAG: DUF4358 domain-containing protein [Lachnospirales bacterium]
MKKILFIILALIMTGCQKPSASEVPIEEVIKEIKTQIIMTNAVEENLKNQKSAEKYGISTNSIIDGISYYSTDNNKSDKVILVRAKNKDEIQNLERALESVLISTTASWEENEEESKKIEKALLKTKDDCVILAISDEVDKIENIFNTKL